MELETGISEEDGSYWTGVGDSINEIIQCVLELFHMHRSFIRLFMRDVCWFECVFCTVVFNVDNLTLIVLFARHSWNVGVQWLIEDDACSRSARILAHACGNTSEDACWTKVNWPYHAHHTNSHGHLICPLVRCWIIRFVEWYNTCMHSSLYSHHLATRQRNS